MIHQLRTARTDDLAPGDYRDIYEELREKSSLRALVSAAGVPAGRIAYWSRYERTPEALLDLDGKNMLRRLVGLSELEPAAGDVVTAAAHPAAEVWQVGDAGPAERVLLLAISEPVTIHVPGNDPPVVRDVQDALYIDVQGTRSARRRKPYWRPALPAKLTPEQRTRVCEFAAALSRGDDD